MAWIVSDFLSIIEADVPPSTLAELIPYLLQVMIGICLVSGVFRVIGKIAEVFTNFRRW